MNEQPSQSSTTDLPARPGLRAALGALVLAGVLLTGCGRDMQDLHAYVAEIKLRKPAGIEPLPEIKPYEKFEYQAEGLRNPFDSSVIARQLTSGSEQTAQGGISPDPNRPAEFLEGFPLDTLRMVGTLEQGGQLWALIKTPDTTVQRVTKGNYLGENNGRVTSISDAAIEITEIVFDGFGGWREREGMVALSE
ncbi:MAG: pilus assembly protein PilP [Gammaproteobacteria bacterium]